MGAIKLLKLDNEYHAWEQELLKLVNGDPDLLGLVEESDVFCLYSDINALISFYLNQKTDRVGLLKAKIDDIKGNVNLEDIIFLFSFLGEGIHYKTTFPLINLLVECGLRRENMRILYSTYYDIPNHVKTVSFWEFFVKIPVSDYKGENKILNCDVSKHFLCLVRKIKRGRIHFLNELIKKEWWKDKDIIDLSFGPHDDLKNRKKMIDEINPRLNELLPIFFDNSNVSDEVQHHIISKNLMNQLVNIVVETFIGEIDNKGPEFFHNISGNGYITEKSMKPFFYGQLPIWVAQRNTVRIIRELGFDVFDDFFENHYYDQIIDDSERIKEVIKILDNLVSSGIIPTEIKFKNKERIKNNWERLIYLSNKNGSIFSKKIKMLLF